MNNLLNKLRLVPVLFPKCSALRSIQFSSRWKSTGIALPNQNIVIANLCEKLKCSEIVAKTIFDKCPSLRSVDAIRNDSLQLLSTKLSLLSIIENPELLTMDFGN